jgi:hypothetical protein
VEQRPQLVANSSSVAHFPQEHWWTSLSCLSSTTDVGIDRVGLAEVAPSAEIGRRWRETSCILDLQLLLDRSDTSHRGIGNGFVDGQRPDEEIVESTIAG